MKLNIQIISAGAGSGKTFRLTQELVTLLKDGVRANGIIATTFTKKAAAELQERVRVKLLEEGMSDKANELSNALIGTVHGMGVKLLQRFAFEAGVSPDVSIMAEEDQQVMFNKALATVLTNDRILKMDRLADKLGLTKKEAYDWRVQVRFLTEAARANDFSVDVLEKSKVQSYESLLAFADEKSKKSSEAFNQQLVGFIQSFIEAFEANDTDSTKTTVNAVNYLKGILRTLQIKGEINWHDWAKISKLKVGAKSRDDYEELMEYAKTHIQHPDFHEDIQAYIELTFDLAIAAINEYELYKKQRGLIDYTDMEQFVKHLLDHPTVVNVLKEELDLLMVDEFQDTSPIQLEIFLKLSQIAKHSIWVGDPKQSIYGFRGAEPKLMMEIIERTGGVKEKDIQKFSWRSREDIVFATNAIFKKAFKHIPEEQVVLDPKRKKADESIEVTDALHHWNFELDADKKVKTNKSWMNNCIAESIRKLLDRGMVIQPKGSDTTRPIRPGDIAILCRANFECADLANALHRSGLKAAISRAGLTKTSESKLILACLKFILNKYDSLAVAEILLLADRNRIEDIIQNRMEFVAQDELVKQETRWAEDNEFIKSLNQIRENAMELSSSEILNLIVENLDLRRIIASWGSVEQRMANVDMLRKFSLQYEDACNRIQSAASLGGFLLWLNQLQYNQNDQQGSGENDDAINVLTYHKSKGLEWPVVICHNLEAGLRDKLWGVNIISETEDLDLNNILANRWIRYWINPYADQHRNTVLMERLDASEIKTKATETALEEDIRVLYVGITRARDYLVFVSRDNPTSWLNRCFHDGDGDIPTLNKHSHETPFEWKGQFLNIQTEIFSYSKTFTYAGISTEPVPYLTERNGAIDHVNHFIDLQKDQNIVRKNFDSSIGIDISYQPTTKIVDEDAKFDIAKMMQALMIADDLEYTEKERLEMTKQLIQNFNLEKKIKENDAYAASKGWLEFIDKQYVIEQRFKKYPLQLNFNGRVFRTVVDFIFKTPKGLIVIQNSRFQHKDKKKMIQKAMDLDSYLFLTKKALSEVFKEANVQTYVHFVLNGFIVEVETKEKLLLF